MLIQQADLRQGVDMVLVAIRLFPFNLRPIKWMCGLCELLLVAYTLSVSFASDQVNVELV